MAVIQRRTRALLSLATTLYIIGLVVGSKTVRSTVTSIFSPRTHPFRLAAVLTTLLLNFKSLPFVWHIRLFGPLYYQLFLQPKSLPEDALFRPMITKGSRTSLLETDYNLHKSNSTYFADLDIGRTMLIGCLLRKGIRQSSKYRNSDYNEVQDAMNEENSTRPKPARRRSSIPGVDAVRAGLSTASEVATAETTLRTPHVDEADLSGPSSTSTANPSSNNKIPTNVKKSDRFLIALGGVSCHFKRELKPYEEYEIWTRVLSWDRKWIYLVQHMVKAGAVRPAEYALGASKSWSERMFGDGRRSGSKRRAEGVNGALKELKQEQQQDWQKAIFASSVSKYVVKKGRMTIPPELVWRRSDLLPLSTASDGTEDPEAWTAANVEKERLRGMKMAGNFAALDGLVDEFPMHWGASEDEEKEREIKVLGSFQDWLVF